MLTYCTNIHPAESWTETLANVRRYVPTVKAAVAPERPFPIGLRLSGRAAAEADAEAAAAFAGWCRENGCFVTTVNGFPHGAFHHVVVKEAVYLPDWRHPQRLAYTRRLAELLAGWLPPGKRGSISTVPIGFRKTVGSGELPVALANLRRALEYLEQLAQATGKEISLAIEAEPGCLLETTGDLVEFFARLHLPEHLRPFLTVCYDCCHQALQFENPAESLAQLAAHEIRIGHVQVSSALALAQPDLSPMRRFVEPCYLHQTVGRRSDGSLIRFDDLDQALAAAPTEIAGVAEWRIHFHVPVFLDQHGDGATTQTFLREILPLFPADLPLEVETYTWTVLPPELRKAEVTESIIREIKWVKETRSKVPKV
jgi:sugar phosphate isomerase/epimerase